MSTAKQAIFAEMDRRDANTKHKCPGGIWDRKCGRPILVGEIEDYGVDDAKCPDCRDIQISFDSVLDDD